MSKRFSHIVASVLIAVLAFSQVGLNFFHSEHLEHGHVKVSVFDLPPDGDQVQTHEEHCKVCSVDFHGKVYEQPGLWSLPDVYTEPAGVSPVAALHQRVALFTRYRGPPVRC